MKNIRIGYFADGPWAHYAFEKLIEDPSIDFGFIVARIGTEDSTLKKFANSHGIKYYDNVRINSDQFLLEAGSLNCDLFISLSFNQIFKKPIINMPHLRTINCHAGKLPFYRGRNILNWVLINDEKEFGITVHYMDEGIDTGDIISQKTFPITDKDNYNTLLNKAFYECGNILYDAVKEIQGGNVNPIVQSTIHPTGFYCGRRREGDEIIDWGQTSRDLFNFVRSICQPGPSACTSLKGEQIKINRARLIDNYPCYKSIIGQIVGKTNKGFIVKTKDSVIEILEIEYNGNLKIGDRLGS